MNATLYCRMGWVGQEAYRLVMPWDDAAPEKNTITVTGYDKEFQNAAVKARTGKGYGEVTGITVENGVLTVDFTPFGARAEFTMTIGTKTFTRSDFTVEVEGLDLFDALQEGEVKYRLRRPACSGKRPLLLYLHGGGNGGPCTPEKGDGRDNMKQLVADFGPINLAQKYNDIYIMAPQAIENWTPFSAGGPWKQSFKDPMQPASGWYREYLGKVCDIIRRMIDEGLVDPDRVYVTGLSMGGAGTLTAMSVGSDLFAACVPVCPTMVEDTFNILRSIEAPVWVASAYVDHTVYRHKYLVDAIMEQKDRGHKNAHLTLYSPEELAEYNIGIAEDMDYRQLFSENHMSWVLTYSDEYGIMSWLLNQHK